MIRPWTSFVLYGLFPFDVTRDLLEPSLARFNLSGLDAYIEPLSSGIRVTVYFSTTVEQAAFGDLLIAEGVRIAGSSTLLVYSEETFDHDYTSWALSRGDLDCLKATNRVPRLES